jgi:hypothetical protein
VQKFDADPLSEDRKREMMDRPAPADPKLIPPGCDFASAMNSASDLA